MVNTSWNLHFETLGLKNCKINVHLLAHLPHYVRQFGPLAFEDSIGHLVKKSHGTHDIAHEVYIAIPCILYGASHCYIPYSGYFSRGNIFVKVVILAISWKKFRGRTFCLLFWLRARGVFRR